MAWQTPRTWSPGETVTASIMNAHVRDQLNALEQKQISVGFGAAGGGLMATGVHAYVPIALAITITGWELTASTFSTDNELTLDIWVDAWANFPPTVADSIVGTEEPSLTGEQNAQDLTLTTWTTDIDAGDVMAFNVDSVTDIEQATLTLRCVPR